MTNIEIFGSELFKYLLTIRQSDRIQEFFNETRYRFPCPTMRIGSAQYIDLMANDKMPIVFTEHGPVQPIGFHPDRNKLVDEKGYYYITTRADCTDFEGTQTRKNLGEIVVANGIEIVKGHISRCIDAHLKDRRWLNDKHWFDRF